MWILCRHYYTHLAGMSLGGIWRSVAGHKPVVLGSSWSLHPPSTSQLHKASVVEH